MAHRTGQNRQQFGLPYRMTIATPLDKMMAQGNLVRVVVDAIDLEKPGFVHVRAHQRGAPPYSPALLLKNLRLSQPGALLAPAGTGMRAQHRTGVAHRVPETLLPERIFFTICISSKYNRHTKDWKERKPELIKSKCERYCG